MWNDQNIDIEGTAKTRKQRIESIKTPSYQGCLFFPGQKTFPKWFRLEKKPFRENFTFTGFFFRRMQVSGPKIQVQHLRFL